MAQRDHNLPANIILQNVFLSASHYFFSPFLLTLCTLWNWQQTFYFMFDHMLFYYLFTWLQMFINFPGKPVYFAVKYSIIVINLSHFYEMIDCIQRLTADYIFTWVIRNCGWNFDLLRLCILWSTNIVNLKYGWRETSCSSSSCIHTNHLFSARRYSVQRVRSLLFTPVNIFLNLFSSFFFIFMCIKSDLSSSFSLFYFRGWSEVGKMFSCFIYI